MENNFHKAYKEILELLKYIPKEYVQKLPKEMIYTFELKMDTEHQFKIDTKKSLKDQNYLNETRKILREMYRDYWATPSERENIFKKEKIEKEKVEEEKRRKENINRIYSTYANLNEKNPFIENGISYKKERNFMNSNGKEKELEEKLKKDNDKTRSNHDNEILNEIEEKESKKDEFKSKKKNINFFNKIIEFIKRLNNKD